jgi:NADH:ubiquinone oxidoreductase subunit H
MLEVMNTLILKAVLAPLVLFPVAATVLVFGLLLKGADRIVVARLQRRVGPPLLHFKTHVQTINGADWRTTDSIFGPAYDRCL